MRLARPSICLLALSLAACEMIDDADLDTREQAIKSAVCTAKVGASLETAVDVDVENDYLPHVVQCENGAADYEALRAQAVAARSYLYYVMGRNHFVQDGQSDQVYSCGKTPREEHINAVRSTSGEILTYNNTQVCAFYVAGAVPSNEDCVAVPGDNDYSTTEHYVTYNEGLSGSDIEQTSLGWRNAGNYANRGCQSQNGANCLSRHGYNYRDILRFYYGEDIVFEQASGSCVLPIEEDGGQVIDSGPQDSGFQDAVAEDGSLTDAIVEDAADSGDAFMEDSDLSDASGDANLTDGEIIITDGSTDAADGGGIILDGSSPYADSETPPTDSGSDATDSEWGAADGSADAADGAWWTPDSNTDAADGDSTAANDGSSANDGGSTTTNDGSNAQNDESNDEDDEQDDDVDGSLRRRPYSASVTGCSSFPSQPHGALWLWSLLALGLGFRQNPFASRKNSQTKHHSANGRSSL